MGKVSKIILGIEAVLVMYQTLLGLSLVVGSVVPFAAGNFTIEFLQDFITGLIIFLSLLSGWRILVWVLTDGPRRNIKIKRIWWAFAYLGALLTLVSWLFVALEEYGIYSLTKPNPTHMFKLGVFFIIPFAHLLLEVRGQYALKALQLTAKSVAPIVAPLLASTEFGR